MSLINGDTHDTAASPASGLINSATGGAEPAPPPAAGLINSTTGDKAGVPPVRRLINGG